MKLQQRGLRLAGRGLALVALVAAVLPACAERIGKNAAAGALAELQRQRAEANPDQDPNKQRCASPDSAPSRARSRRSTRPSSAR